MCQNGKYLGLIYTLHTYKNKYLSKYLDVKKENQVSRWTAGVVPMYGGVG